MEPELVTKILFLDNRPQTRVLHCLTPYRVKIGNSTDISVCRGCKVAVFILIPIFKSNLFLCSTLLYYKVYTLSYPVCTTNFWPLNYTCIVTTATQSNLFISC